MLDIELISLSQRLSLEGSQARPDAAIYLGTCSEEDEYQFIMRLVAINHIANKLIEEVHRRRFARQVTEHVRIVEKGR